MDAQQTRIRSDGIYTALSYIIARLPKLSHVETVSRWGRVDDSGMQLKMWPCHNMPAEALKHTKFENMANAAPVKDSGLFETPGVAARHIKAMSIAPGRASLPHQYEIAPLVVALLRALRDNKTNLHSLELPGSDYIGHICPPWQRIGMVPVPALISVPGNMLSATAPATPQTENLLLAPLRSLKTLIVQIDTTHPGMNMFATVTPADCHAPSRL